MKNRKHGVQPHPDIIELFIMLFADDVVLLSYAPIGRQHQLIQLAKNADYIDLILLWTQRSQILSYLGMVVILPYVKSGAIKALLWKL